MRMIISVFVLVALSPVGLLADELVVGFQVMKVEEVKKLLPEEAAQRGDLKGLSLDTLGEAPFVAKGFFAPPCHCYVKTEDCQIRIQAFWEKWKDRHGDTLSQFQFSLSLYSQKLRKNIFSSKGVIDGIVEESVTAKEDWQNEPYVVLLHQVDLSR